MTQEEKAKAYDEALERASKLRFQNPFDTVSQMMEHVFPELKESEDERIRKSIIAIINNYVDNSNTFKPKMLAWLEKQGNIDLEFFENGENEKREFVGYGFLKCKGDFLSFKEGETYWLEYVGKDNYNVRSDNLLGQTFHITPQQLYTVFRPTTWLEKQGQVNETIIPQHEDKTCKENNDSLTSEDERIRKEIISHLRHEYVVKRYVSDVEYDRWIAWLEKQGKSKWTDEDEQYLLVCKNALHKYQRSDKWDADIISKWLEDKLKRRME